MPRKNKIEEKVRYSTLIIDGVKYKTLLTKKFTDQANIHRRKIREW